MPTELNDEKPPQWLNFASSRQSAVVSFGRSPRVFEGACEGEPYEPLKRQPGRQRHDPVRPVPSQAEHQPGHGPPGEESLPMCRGRYPHLGTFDKCGCKPIAIVVGRPAPGSRRPCPRSPCRPPGRASCRPMSPTCGNTLSHLLIRTIALECGYRSASLSERIYSGPDRAGILIYIAVPDAECTLGGLVSAGRARAAIQDH